MEPYAESSGIDTSPEMNTSFEMSILNRRFAPPASSPVAGSRTPQPDRVQPRKLNFNCSPDVDTSNTSDNGAKNISCDTTNTPKIVLDKSFLSPVKTIRTHAQLLQQEEVVPMSPPYRKVKALRLFDSPATPKTIIDKSASHSVSSVRSSSKMMKFLLTNNNVYHSYNNLSQCDRENHPEDTENQFKPSTSNQECDNNVSFNNSSMIKSIFPRQLRANLNPFTPPPLMMRPKKRLRNESDLNNTAPIYTFGASKSFLRDTASPYRPADTLEETLLTEILEEKQAPKRIALQETNISRYEKEFLELELIGTGEFGHVYRCLNRLDGCIYAVKKSIKPVAGSAYEKSALNEVWAHAVLGKHDNVVRYYSAWAEDNHMIIQNEYCNGGSLQSIINERALTEAELRTLLLHIVEGLKYIHSNDLVHLDIKAGNIFLSNIPRKSGDGDDGFEDTFDNDQNHDYTTTYKIGDLGHVTATSDPQVEEGDCRYLANEILQEDYSNLPKSDIFSLGITLYEAGGGGPLPKNGPEWHKLRSGEFPPLPNISNEFNDLLKLMMHPNPEMRPSSTTIFNHPVLSPLESKSKAQLAIELSVERHKNDVLIKKLKEAQRILKSYELSKTPTTKKQRPKEPRDQRTPIEVSDRRLRSYARKKSQQRRKDVDQRRQLTGS